MAGLSRADIISGLERLGLRKGDRVMVHSSLAALGTVDGGADTLIDALLEAVGPEGLVAVPTFEVIPFDKREPFDRKNTPTALGKVADTFWRRPEAVRSMHPTHSVAVIGKGAKDLIRNHEKAPTAYGVGTPYHDLAMSGGKILLLGVDQDRNTTLHAAEVLAGAEYLDDITGRYIDDTGNIVTICITGMAGPHRDFIGLDHRFQKSGAMKIGCIGNAVCRLLDGRAMLETALEAFKEDPAAVLCDNPRCQDCVMQRNRIRAAHPSTEHFTLAAVASDISHDMTEVLETIKKEGISALELTVDEYQDSADMLANAGVSIVAIRAPRVYKRPSELAARLGVPLIVHGETCEEVEAILDAAAKATVWVENMGCASSDIAQIYNQKKSAPALAFNPRYFAAGGERPFLDVFYTGTLRKHTAHFYIDDGTFDGRRTLPGRGNAEIKEIVSMLRCRGYDGVMTLRSQDGPNGFREAVAAFRLLLETM